MTITDLQAFVKARGARELRGGKLTYFNVPKGKDCLLICFLEVKSKAIVDPIIASVLIPPILLEPSRLSFDV